MTAKHRAHRPTGAVSTAALLLSLSNTLPNPRGPLGRRATTLAHRLSEGRASSADLDAASACLVRLLDETDTGCPIDGDDLLDSEWDA